MSRTESQARTRQKLLTTARTCFLRDGYMATSLEGIADAAGFSKGAVYSNFRNKDELCLAVLEAIRGERARELAKAVAGHKSLDDQIEAFEAWAERRIGDRAWTALEVEFAVHAARDPSLAKELAERDKSVRAAVVALVSLLIEQHGLEPPMPPEDVATAVLGLGVGLGVQRAIDPRLSVRSLGLLLRLFATKRRRAR